MPVISSRAHDERERRARREKSVDESVVYDNLNSRTRCPFTGESEMDIAKVDVVDLVRALSKKCEELEYYKSRADMYMRWYKEAEAKIEKLEKAA